MDTQDQWPNRYRTEGKRTKSTWVWNEVPWDNTLTSIPAPPGDFWDTEEEKH